MNEHELTFIFTKEFNWMTDASGFLNSFVKFLRSKGLTVQATGYTFLIGNFGETKFVEVPSISKAAKATSDRLSSAYEISQRPSPYAVAAAKEVSSNKEQSTSESTPPGYRDFSPAMELLDKEPKTQKINPFIMRHNPEFYKQAEAPKANLSSVKPRRLTTPAYYPNTTNMQIMALTRKLDKIISHFNL